MRFSTSRKPSPRTRRLARTLAGFFGAEYVTRGKAGLDDGDIWMVVVEEDGNPAGLAKRFGGDETVLRFTVAVEGGSKRLKMDRPVVVGAGKDARDVAEFFGLDLSAEGEAGRKIRVSDREIEFLDGRELVLRLNRTG